MKKSLFIAGMSILAVILIFTTIPKHANAIVLYDVDFSTPPNTVGLPPVTGTGPPPRGTITTSGGIVTVVNSFSVLQEQPLEFVNAPAGSSFIEFHFGLPPLDLEPYLSGPIAIEADLTFTQVGQDSTQPFFIAILPFFGQFTTLAFRHDLHIYSRIPGGDEIDIGTFNLNSLIHLRIELSGNTWAVFVNGELRHSGPSGLETFMLELMDIGAWPTVKSAIDNVVICSASTGEDDCGEFLDLDQDNDGVLDEVDPDPLNPHVCGDTDNDTCDDCSIGTDGLGPAPDSDPNNDGPDNDHDGLCSAGDPNDLAINLLTSGTVLSFVDLVPPFLFLPQVGTLMRSNYFYGSGGSLSRTLQRGYMEFRIPDLPEGVCATLKFREIRGSGSFPTPTDLHELSYYLGSGFISPDNFDLPKTPFATFETDFNETPRTISVDVSSIIPVAEGQILGVEVRLLNNGSETGSEDPFCFSDGPQNPTDLIAHGCFVDNPLGSEFCGQNTLCGVDPIDFHPITTPPRIDVDTDCDGLLDDVDNCPSVANADQHDQDGDKVGDACDPCTDTDGDGFGNSGFSANTCPADNCEEISNPNQLNTDSDSQGDACDSDDDNDGIADASDPQPLNPDVCGDSDTDTCDDCAVGTDNFGPQSDSTPNNDGPDNDQDGLCDKGDPDDDNDSVLDTCDNCQFVANTNQTNTDADGLGDACDPAAFEDVDGVCPCGGPLTGGPANACSGPLFSGPWNSHGPYVSCVSHATEILLAKGKITSAQKDSIMSAAGSSTCGKK